MNQFIQETLWKIIGGFFVTVVWPAIIVWLSKDIWFHGIKIIGRWTGQGVENTGWLYDFTAYFFLEPSPHDKSDRDVIGFFCWKLMECPKPEFPLPVHSTGYEIVKGTLTELSDRDKIVLETCGVSDKRLISASLYRIELTDKRSRCHGTTTDIRTKTINGDLDGFARCRLPKKWRLPLFRKSA